MEFPILHTGTKIYQGVGVALAYLMADNRLDGFVTRSELSHGWVSGLNVSARPLEDGHDLLALIQFLKDQGLMIQVETDGRNSILLETILKEKLIHSLVFHLRGPAELYKPLTGTALTPEELSHSLSLLGPPVEYKILLEISPVPQENGSSDWMGPEQAAKAAECVAAATGSKKHPFFIKAMDLPGKMDIPPLQPSALFKYRTLCRRFMVLCDILKS